MRRADFDGHIVGASFASGDRIVAGRWHDSPFGAFADVMWARPDGRRILMAPNDRIAGFLTRHYSFDESTIAPVRVERSGDAVEVVAGPIRAWLEPLRRDVPSRLLALRPRRLRTRPTWIAFEDRVLRPLAGPAFGAVGVRVRGRTLAGAREWYAIHDVVPARAHGCLDGIDLGPVAAGPPAGFGFSEFPTRPSIVRVTSIFDEC